MKITWTRGYKTDWPYVSGAYAWGSGNAIEVAKTSGIVIDTDAGLQGYGEFVTCGDNYMVAHSEEAEALARLIAPIPPDYLQNTIDLMNCNTRSTGIGGVWNEGGKLYAPDAPGLGVIPDFDSLGITVAEYA